MFQAGHSCGAVSNAGILRVGFSRKGAVALRRNRTKEWEVRLAISFSVMLFLFLFPLRLCAFAPLRDPSTERPCLCSFIPVLAILTFPAIAHKSRSSPRGAFYFIRPAKGLLQNLLRVPRLGEPGEPAEQG